MPVRYTAVCASEHTRYISNAFAVRKEILELSKIHTSLTYGV